jgi:hypothetical protein
LDDNGKSWFGADNLVYPRERPQHISPHNAVEVSWIKRLTETILFFMLTEMSFMLQSRKAPHNPGSYSCSSLQVSEMHTRQQKPW